MDDISLTVQTCQEVHDWTGRTVVYENSFEVQRGKKGKKGKLQLPQLQSLEVAVPQLSALINGKHMLIITFTILLL